ncbi:MAG TPA: hypothetical protein PLT35_11955, partial [Vicinamibacterales bacterium]|nr:hypothetical protein [Vicinamibacterales bacterium]
MPAGWSALLAAPALAQAVRRERAAALGFSANRLARIAPVMEAFVRDGSAGDYRWDGAASTFLQNDLRQAPALLAVGRRTPCDVKISGKARRWFP